MKQQCHRFDCFAHTTPRRYANCCTALTEIPFYECPFFKSKGEVMDEREAMRVRAEKDMVYRNLLQEYGISFKKRGRSNGIQDEGRGQD